MKRFITDELKKWKDKVDRKPLILRGARQVGKTYIIKDFAEKHYDNLIYLNFDHDDSLKSLFIETKNPQRIIEQLIFATGKQIIPGRSLIFFDEVQECPDALNSLKYFYEELPKYHVVAAGSLLGVRLAKTSFPVGKVNFLDLKPMSFSEFLVADGCENLVDYMKQIDKLGPIPEIFASQLNEKLRNYLMIGGMPEVVRKWTEQKDLQGAINSQYEILQAYEQDFGKHTTENEANKISLIWNGLPSQLARENKKFVYQVVKEGARAREYEGALNWLRDAGLVEKVCNVTKPAMPLKAYEDLSAFKIYMLDVGLLSRMVDLDSRVVMDGDRLFSEFKGALAENYCLSMMKVGPVRKRVYYHTFDRYEVDFVLQVSNKIVPVEVKSGKGGSHTSLTRYNEIYQPEMAVRFSMNNLKLDGRILNIPLYLAEYAEKLVDLAIA